jgi:tRNA pseudouridine38/39 synthase
METLTADYSNWSNADLIKRVSELEAKLRSQNAQHANTPSSASPTPPKKRPKRPAKPFDPSKYSTRYIALKFAYLGKNYNGFEYHTNNTTPLPTIEEEVWKALRKTQLIFPDFRNGQGEDAVCWDGCEYSKCGRTDRGVSAFAQVIGLRVRSSRPKEKASIARIANGDIVQDRRECSDQEEVSTDEMGIRSEAEAEWDHITDEIPYIQVINRVLPPDIRVFAWCPNPPPDFSARFSCKERRYRYFFTNPAYAPAPGERRRAGSRGAWLDVDAMRAAAKKLEGLHDFRNFCKIDGSKQISNFERRIFHADIKPVTSDQRPFAFLQRPPFASGTATSLDKGSDDLSIPNLHCFEVHGSAFLWHQVRHMVAVLFLVGQGYEEPIVVDKLLDVQMTPSRPLYDMASDTPLVLWDCIFPDLDKVDSSDHGDGHVSGYSDALDWIYAGDLGDLGDAPSRRSIGTEDRKYGSLSIMENLWSAWRKAKIDEVLAGSLMDVFARQGNQACSSRGPDRVKNGDEAVRVFDGSESPRSVGTYIPIMERRRLEPPDVINARFAARKGWTGINTDDADMDG